MYENFFSPAAILKSIRDCGPVKSVEATAQKELFDLEQYTDDFVEELKHWQENYLKMVESSNAFTVWFYQHTMKMFNPDFPTKSE